jgi:hypothetical protein
MISNSGKLSSDSAAALYNVAQTKAGQQALYRHMAGLVEALQPAYDWGVAQLALDTIGSVMFSGVMGRDTAAVMQYVPHVVHAVQQRLAGTKVSKDRQDKMRWQYVMLVQPFLTCVLCQGVAILSMLDPQVLADMLTQLQLLFESGAKPANRRTAGSCIEALALVALRACAMRGIGSYIRG